MEETYNKIWEEFDANFPKYKNNPKSVWAFGVLADELAQLVIDGKKTATSSYMPAYEFEQDDIPTDDEMNLITDSEGNPKVIAVNTKVLSQPFKDVGTDIARAEGEGDLSLDYWRRVHTDFFSKVAKEIDHTFSEDDIIVTEYFKPLLVL